MQARLNVIRFPSVVFALVFALSAALCLGAVLGYTLRPSAPTLAGPQVIVVHDPGLANPTGSGCVWVDNKKAC